MDQHLLSQHSELEDSHWWLAGRRRIITALLRRWIDRSNRDQRLLDVGCGAGSMVGPLAEFGTVTALDVSEKAIGLVRERYPGVAAAIGVLGDSAPPVDGPFDVVTALDVIEHIDDDIAALVAMRERMSPGALLVCTVPAFQWLWGPHDVLNGHKRRYTKSGLVSAFRTAGFSVEWISYYNVVLFLPVAAVRLARRVLRPNAPPASDLDVSAGPLNELLFRVFAAERHVLGRVRLPFGVSLVAVARNATIPA